MTDYSTYRPTNQPTMDMRDGVTLPIFLQNLLKNVVFFSPTVFGIWK